VTTIGTFVVSDRTLDAAIGDRSFAFVFREIRKIRRIRWPFRSVIEASKPSESAPPLVSEKHRQDSSIECFWNGFDG
jgi:hypothetical protein